MNKIAVEGENRKGKESLVNVTNDREAYPKRWIAMLVQVNCEKKTATRLGKVGYETSSRHSKKCTNGSTA